MHQVLILNEATDRVSHPLATRLSAIENVSFLEIENVAELESRIRVKRVDLLILIVDHTPSPSFLQAVFKSQNVASFRDTRLITIHREFLDTGIQKALAAGAKSIYLEPFDLNIFFHELRTLFNIPSEPPLALVPLSKLNPVPCRAECLGRVGKLYIEPSRKTAGENFGDLQIETDAKLLLGSSVNLHSLICRDLAISQLSFKVTSASAEDTYYHYQNNYRLSWQSNPALKTKLSKWIKSHKRKFALPKTKLLWIRTSPLDELENALNKKIFSVHVQSPENITRTYLYRLNPRIVILGRVPEATFQVVNAWILEKDLGKTMAFSTEPGALPSPWRHLATESINSLKSSLIRQAKPFLTERVVTSIRQAKYLDRDSHYSLCTLSFKGNIIATSSSALLVELECELAPDTLFYLDFHNSTTAKLETLYLKVLKSYPTGTTQSLFHLTCQQIPITDHPGFMHADRVRNSSQNQEVTEESTAESPSEYKDDPKLYFLQPQPSVLGFIEDIAKVLIGLIVIGLILTLIYFAFPKHELRGVIPAEREDVFRAIRDAFK